jgi:hypothetical protein
MELALAITFGSFCHIIKTSFNDFYVTILFHPITTGTWDDWSDFGLN